MKTSCFKTIMLFAALLCSFFSIAQNCTNWLRTPSQPSLVRIGDLDVTGNTITVEAKFNRTAPWTGSDLFQGDIVSKHEDYTDCNYLLRPSSAEITTNNGYFKTPTICPIELNKTYHAALVYDGASLKFYRNGFLMSQVAASGNLILNDYQTQIGLYFNGVSVENFIGYINEVRIWNVARTQAQIRTYMDQSLPSPQTTPGLLAYYTFNNLLNKQGNPLWNGTIIGGASINQTNTSCTFVEDSCNMLPVVASPCSGFQFGLGTPDASEKAFDVVPTLNNEFFVSGTTSTNGGDITISKITASGSLLWSKSYGATGLETVRKIKAGGNGSLLVIGQTRSFNNPNGEILAFKVDAAGNLLWSRKFNLGSAFGELGMDIIETTDGGAALTGVINVNGTVADALVMKLDNTAAIQWARRFDRGDGEDGVGLVQKGDTLIVTMDLQNAAANYSMAINKLRLNDGSFISARQLIPSTRGIFNPYLYRNPAQSGYVISAHTIDGVSYANMKHTIITLNDNFDVVSTRLINTTPVTNDFFTGLVPLSDGSFIGCASPQTGADAYFYRVSHTGTVFAKKINSTGERKFYRLAYNGKDVVGVGSAVENGQEEMFLAAFNTDGVSTANCNTENISISVTLPSYSSQTFTWPNNLLINSFTNTNAAITSSDLLLSKIEYCPLQGLDFAYKQNICNPKIVQFTSAVSGYSSFAWNFGDGQTNTSSPTPQVTYATLGTYNVKLSGIKTNGCIDSLVKPVVLGSSIDQKIFAAGDTTICIGDSVRLQPGVAIGNYCLNNVPSSTALGSYIKPVTDTMVVLTAEVLGSNLVNNPSFSGGNSGFQSDYTFAFPNTTEGQYHVSANPSLWNSAMLPCGDRTSGTGSMLMVNGSPLQNAKVWYQTIAVSPNTTYQLSAWLQSLNGVNPASLQFSINGTNLGNNIIAGASCSWGLFSSTWNSGTNTSAIISIVNKNSGVNGNDFALDDIFFGTSSIRTDSLRIRIGNGCNSIALAGPTTVCDTSNSIQLNITKPQNCSQAFTLDYNPQQVELLSQGASTATIRPKQGGNIRIIARLNTACTSVSDTLDLSVNLASPFALPQDFSLCKDTSLQLSAGAGYASYLWQDGSTAQAYSMSAPGLYYVTATNHCGVSVRDSFRFTKIIPQAFAYAPASAAVCAGDSVSFSASGGSSYQWSPAAAFTAPNAATTIGVVQSNQSFTLRIQDNVCNRDTLITIPVSTVAGPDLVLTKSGDLSCSVDTARLTATGGVNYQWTPANLIIGGSNGTVTVKPQQATTFYVTATNNLGCETRDSITVLFNRSGEELLFMPNAFTPNGDGKNDLYRVRLSGIASKVKFRIFNRWGELIFETADPAKGWDGRLKGDAQLPGVYIYHITAEGVCGGKFEQKGTFVLIR